MSVIWFIIIGALAGYLAGLIWKGGGFGILINIVVGIAGSFIGRLVLGIIGFKPTHLIGSLVAAVIGALILLFIVSKLKK